jgi:hypothetical protein
MPRNSVLNRSRGCGSAIGISEQTRPGLDDSTRIRSHMSTASSMLCVTRSTVRKGSLWPIQRSSRSVRRVSAVRTSSAEKGIHEECNRICDKCACKAHALSHASRELARVCALKAIEPDEINGSLGAPAHLDAREPQRIEACLHILDDGQPGVKRKALENHGDPLGRSSPEVGVMRPAAMRRRVDLPEPERPRSPKISPC